MHRDMFCWLLREKTGFHGVITARFLQNASGITAASLIMSGVDMMLSDSPQKPIVRQPLLTCHILGLLDSSFARCYCEVANLQ